MIRPVTCVIILSWLCEGSKSLERPLKTSLSKARTLFDIPNQSCRPRIGNLLLIGFCDTFASCLLNDGRKIGFCPGSFNVCCLVTVPCGGTAATKTAYFLNPEFPLTRTVAQDCSIRIRRFLKTYDQVRIDFTELNLDPPDLTSGQCIDAFFQVKGSDPEFKIPLICGDNTNQFIYVNFGPIGVDLTLSVIRRSSTPFPARWLIVITQLLSTSPARVPEGCLQYFPGAQGSVRSFNFEGGNIHLANQHYTICLERIAPDCVFTWIGGRFEISGNDPSVGSITGVVCLQDDYITILNGATSATARNNIYCGQALPSVTTTDYRLEVVFNGEEPTTVTPVMNRGFQLEFRRTSCT